MNIEQKIDEYLNRQDILDEGIIDKIKDGTLKVIYYLTGDYKYDPQIKELLKKGWRIERGGKTSLNRDYHLRLVNDDGEHIWISSSPDPVIDHKMKSSELSKALKDGWDIISKGVGASADGKTYKGQDWIVRLEKDGKQTVVTGKF